MSKTRTLAHFDEDHNEPIRTHLVLRAWALQRCNDAPFIQKEEYRQRDMLSELNSIMEDVKRLRAPDKLLGNKLASKQFAEFLPDAAATLRKAKNLLACQRRRRRRACQRRRRLAHWGGAPHKSHASQVLCPAHSGAPSSVGDALASGGGWRAGE